MVTAPNQKVLEVNKQEKSTKDKLIAVRGQKAEQIAARNLTPAALKMWLAVTQNINGYTFALSSKVMLDEWGISIASYNRAVSELKEKGYMVEKEGKKNSYIFYDIPPAQEIEIEVRKSEE
jgi:hypothetical protein